MMKLKILDKLSLICIALAVIGIFTTVYFGGKDDTSQSELFGQITCVISIIGIAASFGAWSNENEYLQIHYTDAVIFGDDNTAAKASPKDSAESESQNTEQEIIIDGLFNKQTSDEGIHNEDDKPNTGDAPEAAAVSDNIDQKNEE